MRDKKAAQIRLNFKCLIKFNFEFPQFIEFCDERVGHDQQHQKMSRQYFDWTNFAFVQLIVYFFWRKYNKL